MKLQLTLVPLTLEGKLLIQWRSRATCAYTRPGASREFGDSCMSEYSGKTYKIPSDTEQEAQLPER